jgi:hypothetical protein
MGRIAVKRRAQVHRKRARQPHIDAVLKAVERVGLLGPKTRRIDVRVSPALIKRARKRTGIKSKSELLVYALASIVL